MNLIVFLLDSVSFYLLGACFKYQRGGVEMWIIKFLVKEVKCKNIMVKIPIRNEYLFMNLIYFNKVAVTESVWTQLRQDSLQRSDEWAECSVEKKTKDWNWVVFISRNSDIGVNICNSPQNGAKNSHLVQNTLKSSSSEMVSKKKFNIFLIWLDLWRVQLGWLK